MKNLKHILTVLLLVPILTSCNLQTEAKPNKEPKEITIQGYSLTEMGLTLLKKDDMIFKNRRDGYDTLPGLGMTNDRSQLNSPVSEHFSTNGDLSTLYIYYRGKDETEYTLPVRYIQGFKKEDMMAQHHYAKINGKRYNHTELSEYLLYQDDQWMVYELSPLLDVMSLKDKRKAIVKQTNSSHKHLWLLKPYEYIENNLADLIAKDEVGKETLKNAEHYYIPYGYSLNEMGLTLNVNDKVQFKDPNDATHKPSYTTTETDHTVVTDSPAHEKFYLNGNFSIIEILYASIGYDTSKFPVETVQGFKKEDTKNRQHLFEIESKIYRFEDLQENIIYEDDEWVVYQLDDYLDILDVDSKINKIKGEFPTYDYTWLKGMFEYMERHISEVIGEKAHHVSQAKREKIERFVKSYVENEVNDNLEALEKISIGKAELHLPTKQSFERLASFVSIDISRSGNEYHVRVVFEAVPKGKEIKTRNQRDFIVQDRDGTLYITSVSRTV